MEHMNFKNLQKQFISAFDDLSMCHGPYNVFDHFLDCAINGFCYNYQPDTMAHIRNKYTQDERYKFGEMIQLWIQIMNVQIVDDTTWYDFFGTMYENLSMTKEKGFAQFFTPAVICDFMAKIILTDETDKDKFITIAEPSAGSGRNCLAAHVLHPMAFHAATDLDWTCVKMSALNFMIHGIQGIVHCQNSLENTERSWRGAFIINNGRAPFIEYIDDYFTAKVFEKSKVNRTSMYQVISDLYQPTAAPIEVPPVVELESSPIKIGAQMSLF